MRPITLSLFITLFSFFMPVNAQEVDDRPQWEWELGNKLTIFLRTS